MTRILNVVSSMNRGGAETLIMNIYRNIDRDKIQFDFVVHKTEKGDFDDEILELGGRIYSLPLLKETTLRDYYFRWKAILNKADKIKVVHIHMPQTYFAYSNLLKKKKLTTIMHSHNISLGKGIKGILKKILNIQLRYKSDYFFACSNEAAKYLFGKSKLNKGQVNIVKNGIDINEFAYDKNIRDKIRAENNWGEDFVIGHVGRFDKVKNHEFLIDIYSKYINLNKKSKLVLIGRGDRVKKIKDKVHKLNLQNRVEFLGVRDNVGELMQGFDAFVFPSFNEGLGIVLIEAQAAGLRCLASDTIPEEVEITDLIEFISLNQGAYHWAERIYLIYKDKKSRHDRLKELVVAEYDITKTAKELELFYENL